MTKSVQSLKQSVCDVVEATDRFFFGQVSPLSIAVFRVLFGFITLSMYSVRFANWRYYYTDEGFLPASAAIQILPEFYRPTFTWFPTEPGMVLAAYIVFLIALVFIFVGFYSRFAAVIAMTLHIAFIQRNYAIGYGADFIATFFFFSIVIAESDRVLSLRAWLGRVKPEVLNSLNQYLNTIGLRLLQLHMCIIYAFTGLEKMKGTSWWDGTAVWSVIGNPQLVLFDFTWLKNFPVIIALMTFSTLFFEAYFCVLVWFKGTRKWILLLGVGLHIGIGVMMGLIFFSALMASTYPAFMNVDWLRARLASWRVPDRLLA